MAVAATARSVRRPAAAAEAAAGGGCSPPATSGNGSVTGVSVAAHGALVAVLGQSYDPGWQATCDGRSLGAPVPLEGYANGWPLSHGCTHLASTSPPTG